MSVELKPCPFCGGCELDLWSTQYYDEDLWSVSCHACRVAIVNRDSKDEAIDAWNTRAERTCHPSPLYNHIFECDVCGEEDTDGIPNYCPGCGAKVVTE